MTANLSHPQRRTPAGPPAGSAMALGDRTAADHADLVDLLDDPTAWPGAAARLLAAYGFRLIAPAAETAGDWHLLVALRDRPTLRHFDPERIGVYAPVESGGQLEWLDRDSLTARPAPAERRALWGHVHVVDRVPVENRYLTFGGILRTTVIDPTLTIVMLTSPAPIVRWGGHSQGTDELAEAMGAFFGRLILPIDFVPGAAARVDALPPGILYRAFLADGLRRCAAAERRGVERAGLGAWMAAAWARARADTAACDRAQRLLRELSLDKALA
jgi:hypothetical protein